MSAPRILGRDGGGCTRACSEVHTFTWPCEASLVDTRPLRLNAWLGRIPPIRFVSRHRWMAPSIAVVIAWIA